MIITAIGNRETARGRFLTKFLVDDGCWEWQAGKFESSKGGYGQFYYEGKPIQAHRFSYMMFVNDIPEGLVVLHTCDNPPCVNPSHLTLGTHEDNAKDRESKLRGRNSRKTHCPNNHEYNEENTYITPEGWRKCRICIRERQNVHPSMTFIEEPTKMEMEQ